MEKKTNQNKNIISLNENKERALTGSFPIFIKYFFMGLITVSLFLVVAQPYIMQILEAPLYSNLNLLFLLLSFGILVIGIILLSLLKYKTHIAEKLNNNKMYYSILSIILLITFCWQIFLVMNITYYPIGDVVAVTFNQFQDFTYLNNETMNISNVDEHLQYYPNLWFMAGLFIRIYKICSMLGLGNLAFYVILILNCLCILASILLATLITKKLLGKCMSLITLVVLSLMLGLSPMCVSPYSDTIGLICTSIILFAFICINNKTLKWILIICVSIFGYFIKPTVLAVSVAIVIYEIWNYFTNTRKTSSSFKNNVTISSKKKTVLSICIVAICSVCVFIVCNTTKDFGLEDKAAMHFGPTHYLMLGLNDETNGTFSQSDENLSASCANQEDRRSKNLEVAGKRLSNLGITGVLRHLAVKTTINYGAGNFMANTYYGFKQNSVVENPLLKWLYNVKVEGKSLVNIPTPFNICCQVLWFATLICSIIFLYRQNLNKELFIIATTLLIISLFNLLSECSQRYMFLYLPFFVIIGTFGFKSLFDIPVVKFTLQRLKLTTHE